jgi:hypothetical protein
MKRNQVGCIVVPIPCCAGFALLSLGALSAVAGLVRWLYNLL